MNTSEDNMEDIQHLMVNSPILERHSYPKALELDHEMDEEGPEMFSVESSNSDYDKYDQI
jgi:hypothetical protein